MLTYTSIRKLSVNTLRTNIPASLREAITATAYKLYSEKVVPEAMSGIRKASCRFLSRHPGSRSGESCISLADTLVLS